MDGKVLAESVARYNTFVKAGKDEDFDKPAPQYAIETGPFYAAWATFAVHDSYAGLRIDKDCRVVDLSGKPIAGLWCGGARPRALHHAGIHHRSACGSLEISLNPRCV